MTAKSIIPRPEHPKPQFERKDWIALNGEWTFVFDHSRSGMDPGRDLFKSKGFDQRILVPFCPESILSGVGFKDFIECMWYHRRIKIPTEWNDKRVLLHFGGVDYESEVFIDGKAVGRHFGGTVSFSHDITRFVSPGGEHDLVVRIIDNTRSGLQPLGKQCNRHGSEGCLYTRTTGIWQTVWMEAAHPNGLSSVQILCDLDGAAITVVPRYHSVRRGLKFHVVVKHNNIVVNQNAGLAAQGAPVSVHIDSPTPWCPEEPYMYQLSMYVTAEDGAVLDEVRSYTGLRKVHIEGNRIFLNNEPLRLRFVLDQGFYPDGIWTAPSDEALKQDIVLSMKAGFNGARLHQKVFEERFHYWADKLGYLTWAEFASWGCAPDSEIGARNFLKEWEEVVARDRNHPSIIAWTPFNETWEFKHERNFTRLMTDVYELTGRLDPTRPVHTSSGGAHVRTDIWTIHNYEQDPKKFADAARNKQGWSMDKAQARLPTAPPYEGQPYVMDEFGGTKWVSDVERARGCAAWGYGEGPETEEDFYARIEGLVRGVADDMDCTGFCYTQLTDVEQERNGIYTFDRSPKFDMARISRIFGGVVTPE